jgi:hypothetical protein
MQALNLICTAIVISFFALTVEGKHMQQSAQPEPVSIVAKYAAMPEPKDCTEDGGCINRLSDIQQTRLAALANHVGRR